MLKVESFSVQYRQRSLIGFGDFDPRVISVPAIYNRFAYTFICGQAFGRAIGAPESWRDSIQAEW